MGVAPVPAYLSVSRSKVATFLRNPAQLMAVFRKKLLIANCPPHFHFCPRRRPGGQDWDGRWRQSPATFGGQTAWSPISVAGIVQRLECFGYARHRKIGGRNGAAHGEKTVDHVGKVERLD